MFGAESRARGLKDQAKASLWKGEVAQSASYLDAFGDLLAPFVKTKKKDGISYG